MGRFLLLIGLLFSTSIFACKCIFQNIEDSFASNDFVAEIEVIKVYNVDSKTNEDDRFYKADIKILKLYKGDIISSILIRGKVDEIYGSACEIDVKKGEKFLIYINPKENFGMSSCTRVVGLNNSKIDKERNALESMLIRKRDLDIFKHR